MCVDSYTLCVRSRARISGVNASDYSCAVPAIPKGLYKATFRTSSDNTVIHEVRVRWNVSNSFDTAYTGYSTALTCTYDGVGVLYITDPPSTIDVQVLDAESGTPYNAEHVLLIHLEKQAQ
jgi:hypothetical protein